MKIDSAKLDEWRRLVDDIATYLDEGGDLPESCVDLSHQLTQAWMDALRDETNR